MLAALRLSRLALTLLPFLVVAGCMRVAGVSDDVPPPLPAVGAFDDGPNPAVDVATRWLRPGPPPVADPWPQTRPAWLGTRELDLTAPIPPTPPELEDRRLPPPPALLPPPEEEGYVTTAAKVPPDVVARSTWKPGCPVHIDDLRYLTVTHWGFDGQVHTGEIIVHKSATKGFQEVFGTLYEARFPIEELRVISMADMEGLVTGDANVSSAFTCRRKVSGRSWSEHSYGKAVDLNPFHNPYLKGQLVIPQLASAYLDRSHDRPGMIQPGDEVVRAFAAMGWKWGGDWKTAKDWMHFSENGR